MLVSVGRIYDTSPCLALALLFFDILNYLGCDGFESIFDALACFCTGFIEFHIILLSGFLTLLLAY